MQDSSSRQEKDCPFCYQENWGVYGRTFVCAHTVRAHPLLSCTYTLYLWFIHVHTCTIILCISSNAHHTSKPFNGHMCSHRKKAGTASTVQSLSKLWRRPRHVWNIEWRKMRRPLHQESCLIKWPSSDQRSTPKWVHMMSVPVSVHVGMLEDVKKKLSLSLSPLFLSLSLPSLSLLSSSLLLLPSPSVSYLFLQLCAQCCYVVYNWCIHHVL